jgi:hypothetical protein
MTPATRDLIYAILARYKAPPLSAVESRQRASDLQRTKQGDQHSIAMKRNHELRQCVLQAMADPDWKRHPVLMRAFFNVGANAIEVDGESIEVIAWADRLAANGLDEVPA